MLNQKRSLRQTRTLLSKKNTFLKSAIANEEYYGMHFRAPDKIYCIKNLEIGFLSPAALKMRFFCCQIQYCSWYVKTGLIYQLLKFFHLLAKFSECGRRNAF